MKIKVNCESFSFGGNKYVKGDVLDVSDLTGNVLLHRNNGLSSVKGDVVVAEKVVSEQEESCLDLNGDGVFDKKDKSIAAKVLASKPKRKKSKKVKGKKK
jgi:hypothetical protein